MHSMLYETCVINICSTSAYQLGLVNIYTLKGCTLRQYVAQTSCCQLLPVVNMRPTERSFSACLRSTESTELAFCYKMVSQGGNFTACATGQRR